MDDVALPPAILEHLRESVARIHGTRPDDEVAAAVARVPGRMPLGTVRRLFSGGPFGWLVDARLDEVDGRLELEVLTDSRMSGPSHYAVDADGEVRSLPSPQTGYGWNPEDGPDARAAAEREYLAHNRRIGDDLRRRGFGSVSDP